MDMKNIRNFSIIAHIDHGKSTLADRILEKAGAVSKREAKDQLLDSMDLERERGITIKLNAASFTYKKDNTKYLLNLIDTPGHVDFSYEVSRSLAACEGAILIVDATQGIEAQTIANLYLALDNNLTIIPVINKIDLPSANVDEVKKEIKDTFGFDEDEIILTSAKTGVGIDELLDAIIEKIPAPNGSANDKLQALIFDSVYDSYRGAVIWMRVVNGSVKIGDKIKMIGEDSSYEVTELGIHTPKEKKKDELKAGEVGYLCASIKSVSDVKVGDTITLLKNQGDALPGYKHIKPMVYCGLYPTESNRYNDLKDALEKLKLNDASLSFEPDTSAALGFGFRCGFLGMLHMDVTEERIEREFKIDIIATSPSVVYEVVKTNNEVLYIDNPSDMPDNSKIKEIKEPIIKASIFVPSEYIGSVMELCKEKRGQYINLEYINEKRVNLLYYLPLSEVVYDFFDKLKSFTKGYASFDYELDSYKTSNLVKMDILINGALVDALSSIVHKEFAYTRGKKVVENLKKLIPRQLFEVPIQAVIGTKVIARSDIKAMKKNVLAKCYGGDITRKRKLLEKQKEGKKRMKKVGNVDIPQEAFLSVLKIDDD